LSSLVAHLYGKRESAPHVEALAGVDGDSG
jgi:hypothetical protein